MEGGGGGSLLIFESIQAEGRVQEAAQLGQVSVFVPGGRSGGRVSASIPGERERERERDTQRVRETHRVRENERHRESERHTE